MSPLIFIIIVNWNRIDDTLECIESVRKCDYINLKIVLVDNNSSDRSVELLMHNYPDIIIIETNDNLGFTGGNNIGIKYAMSNNADAVILLNNDTIVISDCISKMVQKAYSSKKIALVSPVVKYYDDRSKIQFRGSYLDRKTFTVVYPNNLDIYNGSETEFTDGETVCLWGTALLIKREAVEAVGYLDENFFAYWEDTDYCVRTMNAGYYNAVCCAAEIYHKTPLPNYFINKPYRRYYMLRNWFFLCLKHKQQLSLLWLYSELIRRMLMGIAWSNSLEDAYSYIAAGRDAFARKVGKMPTSSNYNNKIVKLLYRILSSNPYFYSKIIQSNLIARLK